MNFKKVFKNLFGKKVSFSTLPSHGLDVSNIPSEEIHTHPGFKNLLEVLESCNPLLAAQLFKDAIPTAQNAKVQQEALERINNELNSKIEELEASKAQAEQSIQVLPSQLYIQENKPKEDKYQQSKWQIIWAIPLCYMLFIGINDLVGISIRSHKQRQDPITLVNLVAAAGITAASKKGISKLAKHSRTNDPKRSHVDDSTHLNTVAWWERLAKGEGGLYVAALVVLLETCFATPGLIGLLSPEMAEQLIFKFAVMGGASLSATINVLLAWACGLEESAHNFDREEAIKQFKEKLEQIRQSPEELEIISKNTDFARQAAESGARLGTYYQQIDRQETMASEAANVAHLENMRWEYLVREWFEENSDKIDDFYRRRQQFSERLPSIDNRISQNNSDRISSRN